MMYNFVVNMLYDLYFNNKVGGFFNKVVGVCLNIWIFLIFENYVNYIMLLYRFIDGFIGYLYLFIK